VVFPAPLMSTIQELGAFLAREQTAGTTPTPAPTTQATTTSPAVQVPATEAAFTTDYKRSARRSPVKPPNVNQGDD